MAKKPKPIKYSEPTSVRVEKAENGFIVSRFTDKGTKQVICKDMREMIKAVNKMFK